MREISACPQFPGTRKRSSAESLLLTPLAQTSTSTRVGTTRQARRRPQLLHHLIISCTLFSAHHLSHLTLETETGCLCAAFVTPTRGGPFHSTQRKSSGSLLPPSKVLQQGGQGSQGGQGGVSARNSMRLQSSTIEGGPASSSSFNLGQWEEIHGNYVLRPQNNADSNSSSNSSDEYYSDQSTSPPSPRALIHFLGGAIVGAAPDITYRYVLEKLSQNGFLIVSTPYTLSFDYITTCDDIITRFERIAPSLAKEYGPIPVIGVGHSCGSLLHLLITTLFPDTPRAANVLISYNNMNVKDAVPLFDELVTPLFERLGQNGTATGIFMEPFGGLYGGAYGGTEDENSSSSSVEVLNLSIDLGRTLLQGTVPTNEALTNIIKKTTPKPFSSIVPNDIIVPSVVRDSIEQVLDPLVKAKSDAGISPLLEQSLDVLEQIPSLIQEVADGARDFNPNPDSVRAAARRAYRARRTLILQYDNDPIDESEEIESLLKEAETVMKNKRPMVDFDVKRVVLKGGHATPCVAPPLDIATKVEDVVGEDLARNKLLYKGADETVDEVVKWLEEGDL